MTKWSVTTLVVKRGAENCSERCTYIRTSGKWLST